jgi:D-alanyl-lipoteichoic acid acyltransferase DltB (MBOAT superfamily)
MAYHQTSYFLFFFPLAVLCYQLTPERHRWKTLLFFNYLFFFFISKKLLACLLVSSALTHYVGLWLGYVKARHREILAQTAREERRERKQSLKQKERRIFLFGLLVHLGLLLFFKYTGFLALNANFLLGGLGVSARFTIPAWAAPVGISFYTLQAVSYLADIYLGKMEEDTNLGRVALYMSFFPTIMEGPICRYTETARRLYSGAPVNWENLTRGSQRMIWGFFKKLVIADRLDILVKTVFNGYVQYDGAVVAAAALGYTLQLYAEFSGCMDIVIGSGEVFGIKLPENFRQPFFSRTASEFWTRWHITLGAWFRDYIFYPVSMSGFAKKLNRNGRKRLGPVYGGIPAAACALFAVWLCNGIWHGSGWHYIFFGLYYFVLILAGNILEPAVKEFSERRGIDRACAAYRMWQRIRTFLLVIFGELFFRAVSLRAGFVMAGKMFANFLPASFTNGTLLKLGLDGKDFTVAACALLLVFVVDYLHERGFHIRDKVAGWRLPLRWCVYYGAIALVIVFGAYGAGYAPVELIYAGF